MGFIHYLVSIYLVLDFTRCGINATPYTAAVYEHVVISPADAEGEFTREEAFTWMSKNLEIYAQQTSIAAKKGAQIIVFPEYGVTGFDHVRDSIVPFLEDIPDPKEEWIPCNNPTRYINTPVLRNLSCLAQQNSIYIVANIGDIKACDVNTDRTCPHDGRYQFNTNVVFDANGKLVARYHKRHMYDETPLFDPSPEIEYSIFKTPFGTFGTIVCFDTINFYPTQVLINVYGVKNILVTSAWNVFYPFVLPTQMYSGLAKRNNVNVIASNIRNTLYQMAGSGIFGKNVAVFTDTDYESSKGVLKIAELESEIEKKAETKLQPMYKSSLSIPYVNTTYDGVYDFGMNMTYAILSGQSGNIVVCGDVVCCSVEYAFRFKHPDELFIVGTSDYVMQYPGYLHMQFCAVHRCLSRDISTCGDTVSTAKSTFTRIKMQAFFDRQLAFPFLSTSPYDNITMNCESNNFKFDHDSAILESDSLQSPLLAAVIFNSLYVQDPAQPKILQSSGGNDVMFSLSLILTCDFLVIINLIKLLTLR